MNKTYSHFILQQSTNEYLLFYYSAIWQPLCWQHTSFEDCCTLLWGKKFCTKAFQGFFQKDFKTSTATENSHELGAKN